MDRTRVALTPLHDLAEFSALSVESQLARIRAVADAAPFPGAAPRCPCCNRFMIVRGGGWACSLTLTPQNNHDPSDPPNVPASGIVT